jgi:uncharacterized protein (TIGR03083 family)
MTHDEYLAAIRSETEAVRQIARTAPLDTQVPTCPKWKIQELVEHVGGAHRFATGNLAQAPDAGPNLSRAQRPEGQPVSEWLDAGETALLDVLARTGPSTPCWTLDDSARSGFWARRMANETAVHRWDAQHALEDPQPIAAELAVDGIDEYLDLLPFLTRFRNNDDPWGDGETIHFHATDAPGEWLVKLNPDGIEVTREHAKGNAAARGTASDILLVMMNRKEPSALERFGDESLLDRWQHHARF